MANRPEKVVAVLLIVIISPLFSLGLILLRLESLGVKYPEPVLTEYKNIKKEWQAASVVADRESEKLQDPSYGEPRRFVPMGTATFLFIHFSTYRVEPNAFAISGLGAKALFMYSNPTFLCSWHDHESSDVTQCNGTFLQPESTHVSYGKQYVGTVVHCVFDTPVGNHSLGGRLELLVTHGTQDFSGLEGVSFVAKVEAAGEYNESKFHEPYQFDHVYCGAALYGSLNPQRVREWIAYHAWFFGNSRAHFYLYDGGGIDEKVRRVLEPWVKLGLVTIMNVRQGERWKSHLHNQFVLLSDCLLRSRTMATWSWFFDTDEFIFAPQSGSVVNLTEVLRRIESEQWWGKRLQRVSLQQLPMDNEHCRRDAHAQSDWGISKMVYRRTQITEVGGNPDRKSFVRADSALATGPHQPVGMTLPPGVNEIHQVTKWEHHLLFYYHFHGAVNKEEGELCQTLLDLDVNATSFHNVSYQFDDSLKLLVNHVKEFETRMIGPLM